MQPAPLAGPTALPLAVAEPGSSARAGPGDDARPDCQHARSAPRGRVRGGTKTPKGRPDPLYARQDRSARPPWRGRALLRMLQGRQDRIRSPDSSVKVDSQVPGAAALCAIDRAVNSSVKAGGASFPIALLGLPAWRGN